LPSARGLQDKHPMVEEPCARKLASTVLKQRVGQRCPTRLHPDPLSVKVVVKWVTTAWESIIEPRIDG